MDLRPEQYFRLVTKKQVYQLKKYVVAIKKFFFLLILSLSLSLSIYIYIYRERERERENK